MPEQESNNPKTLHELVSNRTDDGKNRKVVGYSVASYAGVLSALEKAKMIVKNGETITDGGLTYGGGQNVVSRSWTFLGNYGIGNTGIVDNFYQSDLNQVKVILRDYMPFVLDCKNEDGKFERTCVKRRDYAHLEFLNRGISVSCSQNPQFPPGDFTKDSLERCKNGLGADGDGFIIGLGVAFNQVVINYFRHFYEKIEWTEDKLRSLAAKGYLYGELMVPKGDNAKVLHARITVDISQSETSPYDVFVPVPLMLLDDFKELGYVRVRNNTKEEDVDGKTLLFHLASKKFNHKKSIIEGFSPDGVKDYVPGNDSRDVEYRYTGLNDGNIVEGRLRFYFIPESKEEVARIAGSIPEEYIGKLFTGVLKEEGYYKTDVTVSYDIDLNISGGVRGALEKFNEQLIEKLDPDGLYKALQVVANFESDGQYTRWKDIGDSEGVSAGALQCTENSGGIAYMLQTYKKVKESEGGVLSEEEADLVARAQSKNLTNIDSTLFKKMYDEDSNRMKVSQFLAWTQGYHGKAAVSCCNAFKPKSPLAFAAIAGATNHWPGIMKSEFTKNGLNANMDEALKAKTAEAIHLKVSIRKQTGKNVSVQEIMQNPLKFQKPEYVGRWKGWCNRCKSIIDGANRNDLQIENISSYHN